MAVHFCPAFTVISFLTSLMKISHSGMEGETSSPSTMQLSESASIVKGTFCARILGFDLSLRPVDAEPVNVTTSWEVTISSKLPAFPQMS